MKFLQHVVSKCLFGTRLALTSEERDACRKHCGSTPFQFPAHPCRLVTHNSPGCRGNDGFVVFVRLCTRQPIGCNASKSSCASLRRISSRVNHGGKQRHRAQGRAHRKQAPLNGREFPPADGGSVASCHARPMSGPRGGPVKSRDSAWNQDSTPAAPRSTSRPIRRGRAPPRARLVARSRNSSHRTPSPPLRSSRGLHRVSHSSGPR